MAHNMSMFYLYGTYFILHLDYKSRGLTWRAGAANVEGIIQLGNSVLDDVLSLGHGALQQRKLLLQQLLFQLLLLTCLNASARQIQQSDR